MQEKIKVYTAAQVDEIIRVLNDRITALENAVNAANQLLEQALGN